MSAGTWDLLQTHFWDDFYDAQARALLHGHWDVPVEVVQTEGFVVDDKVYTYFGVLPALARIPILVLTDRLDGRLTSFSMLAAMATLSVAAFQLHVALRAVLRRCAPVTRVELAGTVLFAVASLAGIPLWLASQAIVHHEAQLWGLAFGVAAFAALVRWRMQPSSRRLVLASLLVTAAISTRQPIGAGALVSMVLVVGATVIRARRTDRAGGTARAGSAGAPRPWLLLGAVLLPLVSWIVPNVARFDEPFVVPFERQIAAQFPEWEPLRRVHGGAFRPSFVPTTALQYFRPDGFSIRGDFPWIDYRLNEPTEVGGVSLGPSSVSSSVPVTMPALALLALVGLVVLSRAVSRRRDEAWLAGLISGAVVGCVPVLMLGSLAHRYIGDFYPALLLLASVGFHAAAERVTAGSQGSKSVGPRRARLLARLGATLAVGLVFVGGSTNALLALENQRERGYWVPEAWRAGWVRVRAGLPGARQPWHLGRSEPLPASAPDGSVVVVGECDALYARVDDDWVVVERGDGVGVYDIRVDLEHLAARADGVRAPLLNLADHDEATVAVSRSGDSIELAVWTSATDKWRTVARPALHGVVDIRVNTDPRVGSPIGVHDEERYEIEIAGPPGASVRVGESGHAPDVLPRYPGTVTRLRTDRSTCRAIDD